MSKSELSEDSLVKAIAAGIQAGIEAGLSRAQIAQPSSHSENGEPIKVVPVREVLSKEQRFAAEMGREVLDRTPHLIEWIECETEMGSTFRARVRVTAEGRRTDALDDYRYPQGLNNDEIMRDEPYTRGRIPVQVRQPGGTALHVEFKDWRWRTFLQADQRTYVGKPAHILPVKRAAVASAAE